jgi:hypothetical protein
MSAIGSSQAGWREVGDQLMWFSVIGKVELELGSGGGHEEKDTLLGNFTKRLGLGVEASLRC